MPQVAKQLQAVCRENPAKSRPSCKKKKKQKNPASDPEAAIMNDIEALCDSDCEIQIISEKPAVAMDNTLSVLAGLEGASPGSSV